MKFSVTLTTPTLPTVRDTGNAGEIVMIGNDVSAPSSASADPVALASLAKQWRTEAATASKRTHRHQTLIACATALEAKLTAQTQAQTITAVQNAIRSVLGVPVRITQVP